MKKKVQAFISLQVLKYYILFLIRSKRRKKKTKRQKEKKIARCFVFTNTNSVLNAKATIGKSCLLLFSSTKWYLLI
jgi:hypothetical protein